MLVVSHDDHVVCHHALFCPVIVGRIRLGHVVVHGQHQIVAPALDGQLPDKLDEMDAGLTAQLLEIHVDAVQTVLDRLGNELGDQIFPAWMYRKAPRRCPRLP